MTERQQRGGPRFLWTGLMILVPVLALGAVGLWQLRQDRAAALAEARADAEEPLEKALESGRIVGRSPHVGESAIQIRWSDDGKAVLLPKPIPLVPVPHIEQSADADALIRLLDDDTLTSAEKAEQLAALAHQIDRRQNKGSFTQAGLPVKQLALRNALRYGKAAGIVPLNLRSWGRNLTRDTVINHPSILTEQLIAEAREFMVEPDIDEDWERIQYQWAGAQRSRAFQLQYPSVIQELRSAQVGGSAVSAWIGLDSNTYCRIDGNLLMANSVTGIREQFEVLLSLVKLPHHLGIRLWLDERLVHGPEDAEVLVTAADASVKVRAEIVFTDRDAFFQPVRQRSIRTAWLIALAVLAAGIGWFAAWRAFVRQQELAAMKDNFVSAVSHELKAPIASIGLMAEELGAGSEKRVEYTKLIAGECARLGSLVENVLDYARIESGCDEFRFEEADIGELVRAAAELMRPPAAERGIEIRVEAPPAGELCATVDARAIGRALVNLLDNAIKYAPAEKPITLSAEGNRITVADGGAPIPAGEREQIFERFYRSGSELTRETKGVGIGLSLVRHIARAHDGKAWVESGKNGNRFSIEIGNSPGDTNPSSIK